MDIIDQTIEIDKPSGPESPVSLELLLDTLAALSREIADLPAPLPLFAAELEAGVAEALGVR